MAGVTRIQRGSVAPVLPVQVVKPGKRDSVPLMVPDRFERTGTPMAELAQWRAAIAAVGTLSAEPGPVPEKRAWLRNARHVLTDAKAAQMAMQLAAFPDYPTVMAESEVAFTRIAETELRLRRVAERAGWRRPEPPPDPKRPLFERSRVVQDLAGTGVGAWIAPFAFPVAGALDAADALSRGQQADDYPRLMAEYRRRLSEYEGARRAYPPSPADSE